MNFNTTTKTTDLIMFNSRNLGALIVDQAPHVRSWDEPQYSIQNLGIEESYGFGVLNEGQAIAVAKNVRVRQNEMSTPARPIISIGSDGMGFEHPENGRSRLRSASRRGASTAQDSVLRLSRAAAEMASAAGRSAPGGGTAQCRRGLARTCP